LFVLRGKDVSAPYLVQIWAAVRQGRDRQAAQILDAMLSDERVVALTGGCEKFDEAYECAVAMSDWRAKLDAE